MRYLLNGVPVSGPVTARHQFTPVDPANPWNTQTVTEIFVNDERVQSYVIMEVEPGVIEVTTVPYTEGEH